MSHETEQQEAEGQSPYDVQVDALINRFSALVEYAQTLVFPPLRKGITAPPDMTGWSRWRRIAFVISSPLSALWSSEAQGNGIVVSIFCWSVAPLYWWIGANTLLDDIFSASQPSVPRTETSILIEAISTALLILTFAMIPVAYWRWVEFFRDRRYPIRWRLVLAVGFVTLAISFPYWGLLPEYRAKFPALLLGDHRRLIVFTRVYALLLLPLGTSLYMSALDIGIMVGWLCTALVHYLLSAHDPLPKTHIRKLALEPIPPGEDNGQEWRLTELSPVELEMLRRWAAANREGSDKRLLPTAVLFGVLAIFANTRTVTAAIDNVVVWVYEVFTLRFSESNLTFMGKFIMFSFALVFVMMFFRTLLSLFSNLVTQSLIIEACIVTEYAREQLDSPVLATATATAHKGFWRRLLELFGKH